MAQEFETKVLDINIREIQKKLQELGATKTSQLLMRRRVFDIDPSKDEWLRLRDDGKKTTITYKRKSGSGIAETEEIEVVVDDFEKMAAILSKLGFKGQYYQENRRISYRLKNVEFTIDSWPKIPPYLEIEAGSEAGVKKGLVWLGLKNKDAGNLTVKDVYKRYGIDLHSFKNLRF